jgi:hypothetical protein
MHPVAALMLSEAIEADRRRVQQHPRRWMNAEPPAGLRSTTRPGGFRLPRVFRLADSKA